MKTKIYEDYSVMRQRVQELARKYEEKAAFLNGTGNDRQAALAREYLRIAKDVRSLLNEEVER